jgi:hypothetical protein
MPAAIKMGFADLQNLATVAADSLFGQKPEYGPLFFRRLNIIRILLLIMATGAVHQFSGCSEGPLWRSGKYSPWVRNKWAEEEKVADTLFTRKNRMETVVQNAVNGPLNAQEDAAQALSEIVFRDKVLLMRLHAVRLLGQLKSSPSAVETLTKASKDNDRDIRLAAIESWKTLGNDDAVPQLQEIIGSDTDIDVRLAATEALGHFPGRASVGALSLSLNDRNPALQVRATESLRKVTGEPLGRNVVAWQEYVKNVSPANTITAGSPASAIAETSPLNSSGNQRVGSTKSKSDFDGSAIR